jgi:hypothetical protein
MVRKPIVIDTQLLVLLIVGVTNPEFISRHKRLAPIYTQSHLIKLQSILVHAPKLICTPHILTETSNLLRQVADPMRSQIMATFKRFIDSADERQVQGVDAAGQPRFVRLGLTDAAVLSLDPAEVQILTVDHDLHIATLEKGFEAQNLTRYLFA